MLSPMNQSEAMEIPWYTKESPRDIENCEIA
jgi:hypothetical protein